MQQLVISGHAEGKSSIKHRLRQDQGFTRTAKESAVNRQLAQPLLPVVLIRLRLSWFSGIYDHHMEGKTDKITGDLLRVRGISADVVRIKEGHVAGKGFHFWKAFFHSSRQFFFIMPVRKPGSVAVGVVVDEPVIITDRDVVDTLVVRPRDVVEQLNIPVVPL